MKSLAALICVCVLVLFASCRPSPEKLLATAAKYHAKKQYKEAAILYQKVISKDKKNAEAYYRGGLNLLDEGKPADAVQYLRRAIDLRPDNTDAEAKLAEIYLTAYLGNRERLKGLLPEIEELRNKILQHQPGSFDALRLQAILDLSDKKLDESLQEFAKANAVRPRSTQLAGWYAQALLSAGHADQAEALIQDTLASNKSWGPGYDFLFLLYRNQHNPSKQEAILREHLRNDPKSAAAEMNLANFLAATGRYAEGESVIKRVLDNHEAFPSGREMVGDFYLRARKFDDAIQQYQAGAKENPKRSLSNQERIVLAYTMMGRSGDAVRLAKSLADQNPKDPASTEMYASLLLETGLRPDPAKSLAEIRNLSKNNPSNPVLHLDVAKASLATNDGDKALSETLEALQEEAKNRPPRSAVMIPGRIIAARVYETRGQNAQALEQMTQVLQAQPQNAEAHLLRDQALIGMGQADQAQSDLEALVKQFPESNDARLALGTIYLDRRDFGGATEQYQRVWTATPPDVRGYLGLEEIKLRQGKADEAVRGMSDLVAKNPNAAQFRFQLARFQTVAAQLAYRTNPDAAKVYLQQAADTYKEILKTNPNSSDAWLKLGTLQQALGQVDPALGSYEQASHVDPRNAQAVLSRAILLEHMNRKKEAGDLYNQVLGIDPNNPVALNNLAFLSAENGSNLDQAMSFAERAKQQAPKSPDVSDTLGYVYFRKNLNTQALEIFRQNVQDQPQNAIFHYHLAMALLKNGDKQGARDEAQKALKNASPAELQQIKSFVGQIG